MVEDLEGSCIQEKNKVENLFLTGNVVPNRWSVHISTDLIPHNCN